MQRWRQVEAGPCGCPGSAWRRVCARDQDEDKQLIQVVLATRSNAHKEKQASYACLERVGRNKRDLRMM